MELICQNCNQQIPEYDYDWKRLAAECSQCGTWTAYSSTPEAQEYETLELELSDHIFPEYTDPAYIEFAQSLEFKRSDEAVMITQPPSNKIMPPFVTAMIVASFAFLFTGLLFLLKAIVGPASDPSNFFVFIPSFLIGLLAGLSPLNHFLNSNVIMIDRENIYISARPYPFLNGVGASQRINGYKQFYVTRTSGKHKSFGLFGIDFDNDRYEIVLGEEKFVLLLESEIEKFLKIKDRPVGGSLSNPYQTETE